MENYIGVLKDAQEQLKSRSSPISVKDLTMCHRKKVFSIIDPVPMTDDELYNYISGQSAHDVIGRLFGLFPHRFWLEKEVSFKNLIGRIDVYDKINNCVIEIKSSSSQKVLLKPFKFHEEQIRYYMAMQDAADGIIIYYMNSNFTKYNVFPIYMSAQDRKEQLQKLEIYSRSLLDAIKRGDPSLVMGIYEDEMKWLCNNCPYLEQCKSMRHDDRKKKLDSIEGKKQDVGQLIGSGNMASNQPLERV